MYIKEYFTQSTWDSGQKDMRECRHLCKLANESTLRNQIAARKTFDSFFSEEPDANSLSWLSSLRSLRGVFSLTFLTTGSMPIS